MEEQFILRVPPSVAERIERLMNEAAGASSSSRERASLDLSFSEDGRSGTFMIGNESFPASLLDLPTVVESYKTYDDSVLIKTADIGQMVMVREEDNLAPEGVEYKHGLTPPMRDARRRRFRREPDLNAELVHRVEKDLMNIMLGVSVNQNASLIGAGEGGERKKAAPASAIKPNVQQPGEEAEAERSDSDESVDP
ncbi:transcription initiation factor TFIID subunit 7-like [Oryza brachyantha]|nr:transcription initiation factor TFIID subunit 7-like [Oryza brachyantha]